MTPDRVFEKLKIQQAQDSLSVDWSESERLMPKDLPFLNFEFLGRACDRFLAGFPAYDKLTEAAAFIKDNEEAKRLLWHFHYLVVMKYEKYFFKCYEFPEIPSLAEYDRAFYLILALSGYCFHGDRLQQLRITETELAPVLLDFHRSIEGSIQRTGKLGLAPHYSGWWQGLFNGKLIRLGRLTFLQEKYEWPARIFQNAQGDIQIMSGDGMPYNEQGLICFSPKSEEHWTSTLLESSSEITGNPIQSSGFAVNKKLTLNKTEWRELVRLGDPVIGIHISAGEPLDLTACQDSMERALRFYAQYFPEILFKAFVCETWFLDPHVREFCGEESNIAQFQRRFYLAPSARDAEYVCIRSIFGSDALRLGIEAVPHKSRLQINAAQFKRQGGQLRHGLAIYPWKSWGEEIHDT